MVHNIPLVEKKEEMWKRAPGMEFIGKRAPGMEFIGKRAPGMEFVGKRSNVEEENLGILENFPVY